MDWEASPLLDEDSRVEIASTNNTCLAKLFTKKTIQKHPNIIYTYIYMLTLELKPQMTIFYSQGGSAGAPLTWHSGMSHSSDP